MKKNKRSTHQFLGMVLCLMLTIICIGSTIMPILLLGFSDIIHASESDRHLPPLIKILFILLSVCGIGGIIYSIKMMSLIWAREDKK